MELEKNGGAEEGGSGPYRNGASLSAFWIVLSHDFSFAEYVWHVGAIHYMSDGDAAKET